jgi:hypothetical protein
VKRDQGKAGSKGRRNKSLKIAVSVMLLCFFLCLIAGFLALKFVQYSQGVPVANFTVPSPQMILLTNQPNATVTYTVSYYEGSYTEPGQTLYYGPDSDTPLNTRGLTFDIHVSPHAGPLKFALLLNHDAAMVNATGTQGLGYVDNTAPGEEIQSSCPSLYSFATTQVLSGVVDVDSTGDASISLVGGVPSYVSYPNNGDLIPVNVLQMLPTGGSSLNFGASVCSVNLVNWEQVGGEPWVTPTYGGGQINIGTVPAGLYIESANPPTVDAQTLTWNLQGPADVSYTLFDSGSQSADAIWLFWAGVAAAFSATMFVEFVKGGAETLRVRTEKEVARENSAVFINARASSSPKSVRAAAKSEQWLEFAVGLATGIIIGRSRRRKNHFRS